jgi:diguanylate cyclase (GGDEF)-like protein
MNVPSEKTRILAIDDSTINLKLLQVILSREGFEVITSNSSLNALALISEHSPELLLLDIMMPGLSGLDLLKQLKANNLTDSIPVLMVTARTQGSDVKAALEAGAFDYMKKPLDEVEIVARVRSALRYKHHQDRLMEMATHDSLTGLFNHRLLIELLDRELAKARRKGQSVSFCMVDIDNFKALNDTWGHQAGDLVLTKVSQLLSEGLRKSDPVGRYGGEEFGIVLGGCAPDKAQVLCERLRASIAAYEFILNGKPVNVTVSMGLSWAEAEGVDDLGETDLIHRADQALYKAKAAGRNQLVLLPS